jgi:hypothetical protein
MQELINSVARFSAAMTLFGMQEMQRAVGATLDAPAYLNHFRASLDTISDAIVSELDPETKPTLESVSNLGREVVNKTFDTLRAPAFDPRQVMMATTDMIRKTADAMAKPASADCAGSASGEPMPADEVLAGK